MKEKNGLQDFQHLDVFSAVDVSNAKTCEWKIHKKQKKASIGYKGRI